MVKRSKKTAPRVVTVAPISESRPPGRVRQPGRHGPAQPPNWTQPPLTRLRTVLKLSRGVPAERVISEAADRLEKLAGG